MEQLLEMTLELSPLQRFAIIIVLSIVVFTVVYGLANWAFRHFGLFKTKIDTFSSEAPRKRRKRSDGNHGHASGF